MLADINKQCRRVMLVVVFLHMHYLASRDKDSSGLLTQSLNKKEYLEYLTNNRFDDYGANRN